MRNFSRKLWCNYGKCQSFDKVSQVKTFSICPNMKRIGYMLSWRGSYFRRRSTYLISVTHHDDHVWPFAKCRAFLYIKSSLLRLVKLSNLVTTEWTRDYHLWSNMYGLIVLFVFIHKESFYCFLKIIISRYKGDEAWEKECRTHRK